MNDFGSSRPVVLLSKEFSRRYDVWVASSVISTQIQDTLRKYGVKPIDLGAKPHFNGTSLTFFELYIREAILRSMRDSIVADLPTDVLVLNFSNTLTHECQTWYAQGPVSTSLRNIRGEMPLRYRLPLSFLTVYSRK